MSFASLHARASGDGVGFDAPFTTTASVFRTELGRVRASVDMLAADVTRQPQLLTAETRRAWDDFLVRWAGFYNAHRDVGSFGSFFFSMTTYRQIFDYGRQAAAFRDELVRSGGQVTTPVPTPSPESPNAPDEPALSKISPFVWGLLIVGGIVAVGYAARAFTSLAPSRRETAPLPEAA